MNKRIVAVTAVTALISPLAVVALASTPADAAIISVTHQVRPGDLVASMSKTGTAGHAVFQSFGVALSSDDASADAAIGEYFPVAKRLSAVVAVNFSPKGNVVTQRYVIDTDGDGTPDGELVGSLDGGTDVTLTSDSSQVMKDKAPALYPTWHGNLSAWSAKFPKAVIQYGGFASDAIPVGTEILMARLSYGSDDYKFTNTPVKVKTDVTGYSTAKVSLRRARIDLYSVARPANVIRDAKLQWTIRVDRKIVFSVAQGFENHDFWAQTFRSGTGKHLVRLFKNGHRVRSFYVRTGR